MKANLDKNLAPAWVSGKSYSTGEFCLYNKRLYICTTDNSDAEFDNSKWETRNLVDLVSGGNSNLSSVDVFDGWGTFALKSKPKKIIGYYARNGYTCSGLFYDVEVSETTQTVTTSNNQYIAVYTIDVNGSATNTYVWSIPHITSLSDTSMTIGAGDGSSWSGGAFKTLVVY